MKQGWIILLLCLAMSSTGVSQFSIRPQVGVNFANFNYESIHGSIKGKTGFHFGVDAQFGKTFYVQPGLFFSSTNLQLKDFGDIKISRMHIPLMLGFKLFEKNNEGLFGVRIFAGPDFAFNVKETINEQFTDINKDDFKNFQLSGVAGIGADFSIFFIDIGYRFGLTDYVKTEIAEQNVNFFIANAGLRMGF